MSAWNIRVLLAVLTVAAVAPAQQPPAGSRAPAARAAATQNRGPAAGSASRKPSGSSLGRIRLGASDALWFNWSIGVPARAFRDHTFVEAAAEADALVLGSIEGDSSQKAAYEIPKSLDPRLQTGERAAINGRLRELNVRMRAYRVDAIPTDDAGRRALFQFAKDMGVETIITEAAPASPAALERLGDEFDVNVAIVAQTPQSGAGAVQGRGKRIGVCADLGAWKRAGVQLTGGLPAVQDHLLAVRIGSNVEQDELADFLLAAYRADAKPLFLSLDPGSSGDASAALSEAIDKFEKALLPAMTARVRAVIDSEHGHIRGPDRLTPDLRRQIEAAIPSQAPAKPAKARKLLVLDLNMWSGHGTIPHGNFLLELFASKLHLFEPVFSNDMENLKYPKIKEYDAVFLNNVVGMVFPDPEVREGLLRFVKEGGGLGGVHGTTYAALDWPEFSDMLGGVAGEHHIETQMLKVDDPDSPLTRQFGKASFEHTDEFYHFPASSPFSREKAHVLLSIDVEKSDMATSGRLCPKCVRPDQDYAMSWIKTYGQGRIFCTPLGHTPILFTNPAWVQHLLAGVQFILGDLDADTTPSAQLEKR